METIRSTARFGETYALARYDAICTAARMPLFRTCPSKQRSADQAVHKMYREYQAHLDSILEELHQAVGKLEGTPDYDRISFIQTLHGVGF